MRNPLRSEAEAYRFLGVVIVGAAVIIGAAFINTWLGVAVAVLAFMTIRAWRGHFTAEHHHGVEIGGIYWHFVDVMWIVVFTTVYIL